MLRWPQYAAPLAQEHVNAQASKASAFAGKLRHAGIDASMIEAGQRRHGTGNISPCSDELRGCHRHRRAGIPGAGHGTDPLRPVGPAARSPQGRLQPVRQRQPRSDSSAEVADHAHLSRDANHAGSRDWMNMGLNRRGSGPGRTAACWVPDSPPSRTPAGRQRGFNALSGAGSLRRLQVSRLARLQQTQPCGCIRHSPRTGRQTILSRSLVRPLLPCSPVLSNRNQLHPSPHPRPVQQPMQVIDLMAHQPSHASLERRYPHRPVDVLVLNLHAQRARHHPPDVEETQASLVLLVGLRGLIADPCVRNRRSAGIRATAPACGTLEHLPAAVCRGRPGVIR